MAATNETQEHVGYVAKTYPDTDVIPGKGFGHHQGNRDFQRKVRAELKRYLAAVRAGNEEEMVQIVQTLINQAKANGVRFLRRASMEDYERLRIPDEVEEAWVHIEENKLLLIVHSDFVYQKNAKPPKRRYFGKRPAFLTRSSQSSVEKSANDNEDHLVALYDDDDDGNDNDGVVRGDDGVNVDNGEGVNGDAVARGIDAVVNNSHEIMGIYDSKDRQQVNGVQERNKDEDDNLKQRGDEGRHLGSTINSIIRLPPHDLGMTDFSEDELLKIASVLPARAAALARRRVNLLLGNLGCAPYYDSKGDVDLISHQFDADILNPTNMPVVAWKDVVEHFPWGCELASGGFKKVYKVYDVTVGAYEVVSVIFNFQRIRESKPELDKLAAELAASAMVSSLVQRDICPNFIVVKPSFVCHNQPSSQWHSLSREFSPKFGSNTISTAPPGPNIDTMYICSEHCDQGDLNLFLVKHPYCIIPEGQALMFLFQITVALYAGQIHCFLKHYDLKLSNILLQLVPRPKDETGVVLRYVIGAQTFALKMEPMQALVAKVADFGCSNVFPSAAGRPISWHELGTVVYTPPEAMYLGNAAKQGHSFDIFNLGLCMFHLYSGQSYCDMLSDVECPDPLKAMLHQVWKEPEYSLLDCWSSQRYNTFYRFMVLFDLPLCAPPGGKRVWQAARQAIACCTSTFESHRKQFSLVDGEDDCLRELRERLGTDGLELMKALLSWDPVDRPSYKDVLGRDFMKELRETCKDYGPSQLVKTFTIEE